MTPPGVAEVAKAGTGISLSSPVVYGLGQCAESMLYVVWSRARYSTTRRMRFVYVGPRLVISNVRKDEGRLVESYVDIH